MACSYDARTPQLTPPALAGRLPPGLQPWTSARRSSDDVPAMGDGANQGKGGQVGTTCVLNSAWGPCPQLTAQLVWRMVHHGLPQKHQVAGLLPSWLLLSSNRFSCTEHPSVCRPLPMHAHFISFLAKPHCAVHMLRVLRLCAAALVLKDVFLLDFHRFCDRNRAGVHVASKLKFWLLFSDCQLL